MGKERTSVVFGAEIENRMDPTNSFLTNTRQPQENSYAAGMKHEASKAARPPVSQAVSQEFCNGV